MGADEHTGRATPSAAAILNGGTQVVGTTSHLSDDPREGMSRPALNMLAAAQRVLVAKGFSGLTLRQTREESQVNQACGHRVMFGQLTQAIVQGQ